MGVPSEIRVRIFRYVFEDHHPVLNAYITSFEKNQSDSLKRPSGREYFNRFVFKARNIDHPLFRTSKQIHDEALAERQITLKLTDVPKNNRYWMTVIPAGIKQSISRIETQRIVPAFKRSNFPQLRQVLRTGLTLHLIKSDNEAGFAIAENNDPALRMPPKVAFSQGQLQALLEKCPENIVAQAVDMIKPTELTGQRTMPVHKKGFELLIGLKITAFVEPEHKEMIDEEVEPEDDFGWRDRVTLKATWNQDKNEVVLPLQKTHVWTLEDERDYYDEGEFMDDEDMQFEDECPFCLQPIDI
ncbi:hypothetical protein LTR05_007384 [Lithohypha guttulata]|uniref:Uncharacterized protein n=1 Tax=Lithohypha guttulata TaxID=1690604 RepID=A0AAN7Y933_9EURO|nr:hypothetical protein LTR05_007384 [Lithohypha guttulata]